MFWATEVSSEYSRLCSFRPYHGNGRDKKIWGDWVWGRRSYSSTLGRYHHFLPSCSRTGTGLWAQPGWTGFLAVHGFLHLNGYDHQTEEEAQEMFKGKKRCWRLMVSHRDRNSYKHHANPSILASFELHCLVWAMQQPMSAILRCMLGWRS